MKYLLLIFTLILSSPSWGETVSSGDVVINPTDGLVYKKFTTEPFTGSFMDLDILLKVLIKREGHTEFGQDSMKTDWCLPKQTSRME